MVLYICPRCIYYTFTKSSMVSHLNRATLCKLDAKAGIDIDPKTKKDLILSGKSDVKIQISNELNENNKLDEYHELQRDEAELLTCIEKYKKEIVQLRKENAELKRQLGAKKNRPGYLYAMHNPVFAQYGTNVHKIGCSTKPMSRLTNFTTSYVEPSVIRYCSLQFPDKLEAEKMLFESIKEHRLSDKREFFNLPLDSVIEQIKLVEEELIGCTEFKDKQLKLNAMDID